jgi:hypothetical protein
LYVLILLRTEVEDTGQEINTSWPSLNYSHLSAIECLRQKKNGHRKYLENTLSNNPGGELLLEILSIPKFNRYIGG